MRMSSGTVQCQLFDNGTCLFQAKACYDTAGKYRQYLILIMASKVRVLLVLVPVMKFISISE